MTQNPTTDLREALMEDVSNLPRFATNTGDYVDVEAVLDAIHERVLKARATAPAGLRGLRALSDAATPGPWHTEPGPRDEPDWPDVEIVARDEVLLTGQRSERADAAFIVAAVNYVRAALAASGETRA